MIGLLSVGGGRSGPPWLIRIEDVRALLDLVSFRRLARPEHPPIKRNGRDATGASRLAQQRSVAGRTYARNSNLPISYVKRPHFPNVINSCMFVSSLKSLPSSL